MEKRFETRKREIEQDAALDKKDLAGAPRRLDQFLAPFFETLPRSETRENASMYVQGLLSDLDRKNVESIAYRFGHDRRHLQYFIGASHWNHHLILDRIAQQVGKLYGESDGIIIFDPSAFEKDGKQSAGVARQYLGRFGKVDNGQVGTFMAYATRKEHVLVNAKLFIPQEWNDDPARCERVHIPKEEYVQHKTRHQHCLEMLDEQGKLLPHQWIAGDDELGRSSSFRQELRNRNEHYLLAVPSNTKVCAWKKVLKFKGSEALPQDSFDRVDEWKDCIKQSEWSVIDVRDGEKRPLVMRLVAYRVMAHTECGKAGGGESEWVIIVERPEGNGVKYDYYLSNALDTSPEELARVILASHRIEDCFQRAKGECGLADYEVRTWLGWHHHVSLSLLAAFFLTKETVRAKKKSFVDGSDLRTCVE